MLIGLSGWAGVGKDTVGGILSTLGFENRAIANRIKNEALAQGWSGRKDDKGRALLQRVGAEGRQQHGELFWIEPLLTPPLPDLLVITDVRQPAEALEVKINRGFVVRVERPDTVPALGHPNETMLDDWPFDWWLVNDGTVAGLCDQVEGMLYALKWRFT